jgi:hypothetical protein
MSHFFLAINMNNIFLLIRTRIDEPKLMPVYSKDLPLHIDNRL